MVEQDNGEGDLLEGAVKDVDRRAHHSGHEGEEDATDLIHRALLSSGLVERVVISMTLRCEKHLCLLSILSTHDEDASNEADDHACKFELKAGLVVDFEADVSSPERSRQGNKDNEGEGNHSDTPVEQESHGVGEAGAHDQILAGLFVKRPAFIDGVALLFPEQKASEAKDDKITEQGVLHDADDAIIMH